MKLDKPTLPAETDVLIIGAGPTGMALAIALAQASVDHVIVDRLPQGLNTSRAGVIHAHTLEVLDRLGVAKQLTSSGLRLQSFCLRERDREIWKLDFSQLPSDHPYLLMLPQDQTEQILEARHTALGGRIHRNVTATSIEQDVQSARVKLTTPEGGVTLKARYVVGGDGMHSFVREATGTEFEGGTFEESFVLADVKMDWPFGATEVSLFFSQAGMVVVAPLPNGSFRVVATLDQAPEKPGLADVQALLDARGPSGSRSVVREVTWSSRFRLHHRVARAYRDRRLFLMGDAAHVHSPAGGQGMNTGLVDAVVLGGLLAKVLTEGAADAVLDHYEQLRKPAALRVVSLSNRLTGIATMRGFLRRTLRNAALSLLSSLPLARRTLLMNLSGLSRKALAELPMQA